MQTQGANLALQLPWQPNTPVSGAFGERAKAVREAARVLKPGGRIGISDIVAEDHLSPEERAARGSYVGCIAGALSRAEYLDGLAAAGVTGASDTAASFDGTPTNELSKAPPPQSRDVGRGEGHFARSRARGSALRKLSRWWRPSRAEVSFRYT